MEHVVSQIARGMEVIVLAGAFIMAVGAGLKRVYRMARNIEALMEKVDEHGKIAAEARSELAQVKEKTAEIKREVLPNGGSSLRDAINRIETRVAVLETWHQSEGQHRG